MSTDKKERLKINLTFQLNLPLEHDKCGRRIGPTRMVAPFIDDWMMELQQAMGVMNSDIDVLRHKRYFAPDQFESEWKLTDRMTFLDVAAREVVDRDQRIAAEKHRDWESSQDKMCWAFYNMSWEDFKRLSWDEQAKLREERKVVWDNVNYRWIQKPEAAST